MASTTSTTANDRTTTSHLYRMEQLLFEVERVALSKAHAAILAEREALPAKRFWRRNRDVDERRAGLTRAAEIVAKLLAEVDR